jgi:aerobic-type carbon monoxide dehydrogenase small subunit (CoxS/CutS family)
MAAVDPSRTPTSAAVRTERQEVDARTGPLIDVRLRVNGKDQALRLDPHTSLLDALRERLGLTGAKKGCDHGQCGACTVHADGRHVVSCLTLAVQASGHSITTIEGLAGSDGALHPMQQAFIDHDALQCGYCTPLQAAEVDQRLRLPDPFQHGRRSARLDTFSLHAGVRIHENDRQELERLCRYAVRPPFALHRLSQGPDGRLVYRMKRPRGGSLRLALTTIPVT